MTPVQECFLCGDRVIGIAGQDTFLEPYHVDSAADPAIVEGRYGACHFVCLKDSDWGRHWAAIRRRYYRDVLSLHCLLEVEGLAAFDDPKQQATQIIRDDGVEFFIAYSSVNTAHELSEGFLLPVKEQWHLYLPENQEVTRIVQRALREQGRFSMSALIRELSLWSRLLFPYAIEDGELRIENPNSKKTRREIQGWSDSFVSSAAFYSRFVPRDVLRVAQTCKPFQGSTKSWRLREQ